MQHSGHLSPARFLLAAALVAASSLPADAFAAADRAEKEARAHFQKAEGSFNLGKFDEALTAYEAAYEAKALPAFLFNIAQCYRHLGNPERARFFYQRYLALEPDTPNRKVVDDLVAEMDRQIEEQQKEREAKAAAPVLKPKPRPATLVVTDRPESRPQTKPLYTTWWLWTGIGAIVVGAALTTFLVTRSPEDPRGSLGAIDLR